MRIGAIGGPIRPSFLAVALLAAAILPWHGAVLADDDTPGVGDDVILFGQSAALTGPAAALGEDMQRGILAAFDEVNRAGGIDGRRLELLTYDDRYEPETAIENTQRLIESDRVFALIGPVGTPTSMAAEPIATANNVPLIGAFTGAEFLRNPELRTVVNLRASYFQETERIVDWLTRSRGAERVAILYQDDSYGRAGRSGVIRALEQRALETVSEGVYPRNTLAIKRALLSIARGNPDAIVIVGAYGPSAEFIKWAHKLGIEAIIVNVSFVGTRALVDTVGEAGVGTVISQVVPTPFDASLPLVADYQAAMKTLFGDEPLSFVSLEGYLAGRLTIAVLERIDGPPTRAAFLAVLDEVGHFDIGGFPLAFAPGDNQGSDRVFLTVIEPGGGVRPIDETVSAP
jgi:branched-chain amino acid transport system substrate-binding protein